MTQPVTEEKTIRTVFLSNNVALEIEFNHGTGSTSLSLRARGVEGYEATVQMNNNEGRELYKALSNQYGPKETKVVGHVE